MRLLFVFLGAIAIIILGARGTYKSVWNQFFPNEQITTTPTSTTTGNSAASGGSSYNPSGGQPGQTPTTPVQVGQQGANATKQAIKSGQQAINNFLGGGSNTQPKTPIQVPPGKKGVISTGVPSWWPSWLPYPSWFPHPGEGATGQII